MKQPATQRAFFFACRPPARCCGHFHFWNTPVNIEQIIHANRDLLNEREAAQFLSLQHKTLANWRSAGRYALPFVKVGRAVRYRRSDLVAWLAARTRANGATA